MSHPGSLVSVPTATRFQDCLRRCEPCAVGASNGAATPTYIHLDPHHNIPAEARLGAEEVIGRALNVRNRNSKWLRFGYSTSEDAVTWVVFKYLLRSGKLVETLKAVGVVPADAIIDDCKLLLWGVPVDDPSGEELRLRVAALCSSFGESQNSFSEPDVVVDLGSGGVVFIEVKHRSGNEVKDATYPGWPKYAPSLQKYANFEQVRESGYYELARNWCLLKGIADARPATLINLGPPSLFRPTECDRLRDFAAALRTDERSRFETLTWTDFLHPVLRDAPHWLGEYCHSRGLLLGAATPDKRANGPEAGDATHSAQLECVVAEVASSESLQALNLLQLKDRLRSGGRAGRAGLALGPEALAAAYERLVPAAPRRNRPYLSPTRNGITSSGENSNREEEHLAVALFNGGAITFPDGASILLADYQFPLKAVRADAGIGKVDLLGVDAHGKIVVIELKVGRSREDRLVGLIEGLVYAAVIEANIESIACELEKRPDIVILAPDLYWTSSEISALRELKMLAAGLEPRLGMNFHLYSLDAQLASFGLSGGRPQLQGSPLCRPSRADLLRN